MAGGGDFVSIFQTRGQSFALKSCSGTAILRGKIIGPGLA